MTEAGAVDSALAWADWIGAHAPAVFGIGLAAVAAAVAIAIAVLRRFSVADPHAPAVRGGAATGVATTGTVLLRLALALALALAGAKLFAAMMEALEAGHVLGRFDTRLAESLAAGTSPEMLRGFGLLTHLGDPWTLAAIIASVTGVLIAVGHRSLALACVLVTAGSGLFNRALKEVFARARPLHDHGYAVADGFSFPSGHSSGSLVTYGFLAYLAIRLLPARAWIPVACLAAGLAYSIGASRVILRVHWATDVFAGFGSGFVWLVVCVTVIEAWRRRRSPR